MRAQLPLLLLLGLRALAQTPCEGTQAYSPCEIAFDLTQADLAAHSNPYLSVQLHAEFRSPHFRTFLMPAYWDGGRKMIFRFTPTEAGEWIYRVTSNLSGLDGKQGKFNASESSSPGFIKPANIHHWATDNKKPHLWMGYIF